MGPVPDSEINNIKSLYLPHHGVVRDISCTTKLRVVFDASSKTSSGLSLNDMLMVGPRVQPELFPILIQFRIFSVAICADVDKMFRQIKVHEEDVDWQRILWRDSPTEPIREYRLTTLRMVRPQHHSSLREPCDSLPLTNKKIIQPLQELPLVIFTLMTC
ncbi:integrase catalytic domain-containing protein [Trichonephila clavipes]|nr:integrase catalytic domain-containing protein [Trichonephila clavipes]